MQGPIYHRSDLAGFWRRSLALVIDLALMVIFYAFVVELIRGVAPPALLTYEFDLLVDLALVLCCLAYMVGMRLTSGGTLGYRIVGIRYAYMLDETPGRLIRLYRAAIAVFLLWAFGLDHVWILFDPNRQAWHDKLSGFYVVRRRAEPRGTQTIIRRVINFMMLSFVVYEPQGQTT